MEVTNFEGGREVTIIKDKIVYFYESKYGDGVLIELMGNGKPLKVKESYSHIKEFIEG